MTSTTAPAHRRRIPKRTAAIAAFVLGATAISLTLASPASADPIGKYVAVGSDTTQDVMDGLANQLGGGYIGSYDAFDPVTGFVRNPADGLASDTAQGIKIKPSANVIPRPNGSGDGLNALRGA